ncbi:MAG TPA: TIGR02466 family protein [Rhizomicrobium sp.]
MPIETLFATRLYRKVLPRATVLNAELSRTCISIAQEDRAGQRWSKEHGYTGYTSYASLNDLPLRAPVFADLQKHLDAHVKAFAKSLDFASAKLALDSLWINVMERGGVHTGHIHPHSVISGTYYVAIPKGAAAVKFEDPRLPMMMAAPAKKPNAARDNLRFVTVEPVPGTMLLWESWLRHEVPPNAARGPRISLSFNYASI